ncbi:MAG TPA: efflux RND transporter permease subunit [Pirellulales bacterium]|nr:efflux RND transporter permease subunit [Pirellulales bacterium]
MLNSIIQLALRYRLVTVALAIAVSCYGMYTVEHLPIDVLPDLNRPRVTILTEAPGLAPEEVETLITFPLETVLNGATGVQAVRSSSAVGLSIVNVEFAWDTDLFIDRQIVNERMALVVGRLPQGMRPQLAPIASIMGQVMLVGMWSDTGKTDPIELRTLADWTVRQRLLSIPGVAQVVTMGGGRKQFQVLVNPEALLAYEVSLAEVERAVADSNSNAAGGYLKLADHEYLVRSLGRIQQPSDLESVVVRIVGDRPILLSHVARVIEGPDVKRGDAAVNGTPAVMLTISKQPGADTRRLTENIVATLNELRSSLPDDVRIDPQVYQQKQFIDLSIQNVLEALRDGGILVVLVLVLFLLNLRTTVITLVAIPLSILTTALVFKWLGMSINTMTLGGLAVAIGELVDDAIVDVENIHRRLGENARAEAPKPVLRVVYEASSEVRNPIVFSTVLVVLVFVPLLALGGIEGRLFVPLGIAYIVSILASLVVSLTVTPALASWLLPRAQHATGPHHDWLLPRGLKWLAGGAIRLSLRRPWAIFATVLMLVVASALVASQMGSDFLPPFNEGSAQVNVLLPPGTSLEASDRIARTVDRKLLEIPGVVSVGRRTGRAELDEHAEGVNVSEMIVAIDPQSHRGRAEILADVRNELANIPEIVFSVEQPLQHLISHMLSGVKAQVAIKVFGDNLDTLRTRAEELRSAIASVAGVTDLFVEQQVEIPQVQVRLHRDRLATRGLNTDDVNRFIETAMNGRVVSEVVLGQRKFDLAVRLDEPYRQASGQLRRLTLELPDGGHVPLEAVADVVTGSGPNTINRENVQRRIVVQCNVAGRDLAGVMHDIRQRASAIEKSLPTGYWIEYGGQFESQQQATRTIAVLGIGSLACMFLALYTLFRSVNLALQVLSALPMAAIGAVAALAISGQTFTIASLVGFISLAGIASRNGILLVSHYLHLVREEGESFTGQMIERAGKERLAPMLMTALTAGLGLIPLVLHADEPGKELLYPVATVILGGLVSSTLLDFFVHPALFWCFGRRAAEATTEG